MSETLKVRLERGRNAGLEPGALVPNPVRYRCATSRLKTGWLYP